MEHKKTKAQARFWKHTKHLDAPLTREDLEVRERNRLRNNPRPKANDEQNSSNNGTLEKKGDDVSDNR